MTRIEDRQHVQIDASRDVSADAPQPPMQPKRPTTAPSGRRRRLAPKQNSDKNAARDSGHDAQFRELQRKIRLTTGVPGCALGRPGSACVRGRYVVHLLQDHEEPTKETPRREWFIQADPKDGTVSDPAEERQRQLYAFVRSQRREIKEAQRLADRAQVRELRSRTRFREELPFDLKELRPKVTESAAGEAKKLSAAERRRLGQEIWLAIRKDRWERKVPAVYHTDTELEDVRPQSAALALPSLPKEDGEDSNSGAQRSSPRQVTWAVLAALSKTG
mmetsp:Transcript_43745/g.79856  ORF Transcript_43745/g.79856 Transcript_43745/m.79856 type:complete len:276 (+) Transcript_43745:82-909(+)